MSGIGIGQEKTEASQHDFAAAVILNMPARRSPGAHETVITQ
jgi:hypothetical protein